MIIKQKVKLGNNNYYLTCECIYKKKNDLIHLCLKEYKDDYYDGGDLSSLVNRLEKDYRKETVLKYDGMQWFLADCLYIYDHIPFISGVGDYYISSKDQNISSSSYITKEELDNYIKENSIVMRDNAKFKLSNSDTWFNN